MLPLDVKAYLSDLMEKTYSRSALELLANKFGVEPNGMNKLQIAQDFLSKVREQREKELIGRVIYDARKRADLDEEVCELLSEFERILESTLFLKVDENRNVVPIVEPLIKPDMGKERGFLE